MDALVKLALWAVGLFGGLKAVEKALEDFVMNQPWMPAAAKKYVVPVIGLLFSVGASIYGGMAPGEAILAGLGLAGGVALVHDHPALTSADWALPAPPADAQGVPGDPA